MSDEQVDEQKYGLEAEQQGQGYRDMPMAVPDEPKQPALTDEQLAHFNRPPPPPPVERTYTDQQSGVPRPENEVVELDRASRDITAIREAERLELEKQHNSDLNEALDWLQRETSAQQDAATPRPEQQPAQPVAPEALTPEAFAALDYEQQTARIEEADKQLQAALADPIVRERIEGEFNQVRAQAAQQVEQHKQQFQQAFNGLANEAVALLGVVAPELAGMSPAQVEGALRVMPPERAQAIKALVGRTQQLVGAYQQQVAQQQTQQQQQAAAQFRQFAQASDNAFDAMNRGVPKEQMAAIKEEAVSMLKEYGLTDADLAREYNSNPLFRSAVGQRVIADAARWRLAQRSLSRAQTHQVPHVVRPGSTADSISRKDAALAEAQAKLRPEMTARQAADYLIAPRGANRRT